jgi:hypothetical protein
MDMFIAELRKGGKYDAIAFLVSRDDLSVAVEDAQRRRLFTSANFDSELLIVGRDRVAVDEMRKQAE